MEHPQASFPYTGLRDDCFLGTLSFLLLDAICAPLPDDFTLKWKKALLHLEALMFYQDLNNLVEDQQVGTVEHGKNRFEWASGEDTESGGAPSRATEGEGGRSLDPAPQTDGSENLAEQIRQSETSLRAGHLRTVADQESEQAVKSETPKRPEEQESEAGASPRSAASRSPDADEDASEEKLWYAGFTASTFAAVVVHSPWPIFVLMNDISELVQVNFLAHVPNQCDLLDTEEDIERGRELLSAFGRQALGYGVWVGVDKGETPVRYVHPGRLRGNAEDGAWWVAARGGGGNGEDGRWRAGSSWRGRGDHR